MSRIVTVLITIVVILTSDGVAAQTPTPFWNDYPSASIAAPTIPLPGRLFLGGGILNDNRYYPSGGPLAPDGFSNRDWFSSFSKGPLNGVVGASPIYADVNFAQVVILYDPLSAAAALPIPQVALTVAAKSGHAPFGATPRGFSSECVNDSIIGVECWGGYVEVVRTNPGAGHTWGMEFDVRNSGSLVTWTPHSTPGGGTVIHSMACGAGVSSVGQFNCTASHWIGANALGGNIRLQTGILFASNGIASSGPGGTIPAVALPPDYANVWYKPDDSLSAAVSGDASGNFNIMTNGGTLRLNGITSLSSTKTVRSIGGSSDCTLVFTGGLLTGGSC